MVKVFDNPELINVEKPARYTDAEWNAIHKEIELSDCAFALAFPDSYEIAESGLGFKILYNIINAHPRAKAERVFAPMPDMEEFLRRKDIQLYTLESGASLKEFDIVGFSLQYQMTYTNLLNMLDLAKIPLYSCDRDSSYPLIIAGGPGAFNPEPIADFLDAVLIGDGEEGAVEIIDAYLEWKNNGSKDKAELLRKLAKIEGVYVPSLYKSQYDNEGKYIRTAPVESGVPEKIKKRIIFNLDSVPVPTKPVVPYIQTIHDRVTLEVFRGCTRGCRFCQAGFIYRPIRERSEDKIVEAADISLKSTGYDEISLLSLSCTDYSRIKSLLTRLSEKYTGKGVSISLPSLRMDNFSLDLVSLIMTSRKAGLTFAPEAGTQRLRDVINKNVTEEDFISTLKKAKSLGWQAVKLYFMIGLPSETDEDVEGIANMALKARKELGLNLHVSVSHFVPQPFTPFQWEPMEPEDELKRKAFHLKDELRSRRIQFNYHDTRVSFLEGVFTRGDRRLSKVIEEAFKLGCRLDGWSEYFNFDLWMEAFKNCGVQADLYNRRREIGEPLPWDHIDCGVSKKYLKCELEKAFSESVTPDCREECAACGVCTGGVSNLFSPESNISNIISPSSSEIHERRQKIRMRMTRSGALRWISHLDAQRAFERAIRRAGIPISYTEGFHPRPRLSLAIPLPLGCSSEAEWADIILYKPENPVEIKKALNEVLPDGMQVLRIKEVSIQDDAISANLLKVDYGITVAETDIRTDIGAKVQDFLKSGEIIVERKGKSVNIRPLVEDISTEKYLGSIKINVAILMRPTGSAKPSEVIEVLLGSEMKKKVLYHREGLYVRKGSGWDLP